MSRQPWLWLIADPNGAGKSTYAPNLAADVEEIVRPDELAYRLAVREPETVALQAGRWAIRLTRELLARRCSFAVETTLSGRRYLQMVRHARSQGWAVGVPYIGLSGPELAIERVRERVNQGGHHVPAAEVHRRYHRSLKNLNIICQLADRLVVLDNSSVRNRMKRVLEIDRGIVVYRQRRLPKWLARWFVKLP